MSLIDSGRLREARALWEAALRQQPRSASLHFNLAAVCEAIGDRKAAERHYTVAHELAPKEERYTSEMRLFTRRE
jgi:Flp pilus assembly protein TadD